MAMMKPMMRIAPVDLTRTVVTSRTPKMIHMGTA